jgi:hypothetical protein
MPNDPMKAAIKVLPHPRFIHDWKRMFAGAFAYFAVSVGGVIYLGNHGYSDFADSVLWFVLISNLLFFIGLGAMPYLVRCATCQGKAMTKSRRAELPDHWSAHCKSCNVLWDLGLGNSD